MDLGAFENEPLPVEYRALAAAEVERIEAEQRQAERFAIYRQDPTRYAREVLGITWWSKQIEIAESILHNRRTVVYAGHAVGKTHLMGGLVQWSYDCFNPGITLTTAPNWASIHDLLWAEIKAQRQGLGLPGQLYDLLLGGGLSEPMHYAQGHNAETSSGFQGRHEARVVLILDEAMGIPPWIWEGVNAMMTSPDCRVCALGNPTDTSGDYFDIRDDPSWNVITISCLEHPNIAAELAGLPPPYPKAVSLVWVREMIEKHCIPLAAKEADADCFEFPPTSGHWYRPDDVARARMLGIFPKQASNAIWSDAWLIAARQASLTWKPNSLPQIGVDVARYGDDKTTLYARRGPKVTHRETYAKQGLMETVGRVLDLAKRVGALHTIDPKRIPINVDDTGLGGGVTDRALELGYDVHPVDFGGGADNPEEYFNCGSEMWFQVAERACRNKLDLSALEGHAYRQLAAELRARRYKIQSDKTLRAEGKDDLRKRLGRSPDDADGLCLAFKPLRMRARVLEMEDEEEDPTATPKKPLHPYIKQLHDAFPKGFEKLSKEEICGNCLYFTHRKSDGKGFCTERELRVEAEDKRCELFDIDDISELYPHGDEDDRHDEDDDEDE